MQTEAGGIPVGLAVGGANVHDIKLLQETIEDCLNRATGFVEGEEHMCLDKGYDSAAVAELVE